RACAAGAAGEILRVFPRSLAPGDLLSCRAHGARARRGAQSPRVPARTGRTRGLREAGLPHESAGRHMTDWSAADLTIVWLSLKVALVGTIASLPFAIGAALLLA